MTNRKRYPADVTEAEGYTVHVTDKANAKNVSVSRDGASPGAG